MRCVAFRRVRVFVLLLMCAMPASIATAVPVTGLTFVPGMNVWHGWRFVTGTTSIWGGAVGEYIAVVDGTPSVGYFRHPSYQSLDVGTLLSFPTVNGAYSAAWMVDQFAAGLGRDWHPSGWSGYSGEEARMALALAVFEVSVSPPTDPFNLSAGYFGVAGPANVLSLAQAYLDALTGAVVDVSDLESRYSILQDDTWISGSASGPGLSTFVTTAVGGQGVIPEPGTMALLALAGLGLLRRRRRKR